MRAAMTTETDGNGADATRVAVFLLLLALVAFHPAVRCGIESIAGRGSSTTAGCQLAAGGAIFCLDEEDRVYPAR
jgi:hypothetical protein